MRDSQLARLSKHAVNADKQESPVRADIIKAAPLAFSILPEHQILAQNLDCIWSVSVQVFIDSDWVPLLAPDVLVFS